MGSYGFINSKAAFYNIIRQTFSFTDVQLGNIWSVYGIASLASYLLGGYLADRIPAKRLLTSSLLLSAILHSWLSLVPGYRTMLIISVLLSVSAVLSFFPAASKLLSAMGGASASGGTFGLYYALEGGWNTLFNLVASWLYSRFGQARQLFVIMMRSYAAITFAMAICLGLLLDAERPQPADGKPSFQGLKTVLPQKSVWLLAIITMCTYTLFCSLTYITPYLTAVYGMREANNLFLAVVRVDILAVAAGLLLGMASNRRGTAGRVIKDSLAACTVCALIILLLSIVQRGKGLVILLSMVYALLAIGTKSISLALIPEQAFPSAITGTVIGVVSVIGFSPDAFFYRLMGLFLDRYGEAVYMGMFALFAAVAVMGMVCCAVLEKQKMN